MCSKKLWVQKLRPLKRSRSDHYFSQCVRERTNYTCEICHKQYDRSSMGLHCSHFFGRANKSVRWHSDNAFAHCYGCHVRMGSNPHDFTHWVQMTLGQGRYDLLVERKNDLNLAKQLVKDDKAGHSAKHFSQQLKALRAAREDGETSRIEFEDYT